LIDALDLDVWALTEKLLVERPVCVVMFKVSHGELKHRNSTAGNSNMATQTENTCVRKYDRHDRYFNVKLKPDTFDYFDHERERS